MLLTRIRGYLDGRRGAVTPADREWQGHYIAHKKACYAAFVHSLYTGLEDATAPLRMESAALAVELEDAIRKTEQPETEAAGKTASIQARIAGRACAERSRLQSRRQEIELRLPVIEEEIRHAAGDAAGKHRQAAALTERRIQAYLHGASLARRGVQADLRIDIRHDFPEEEAFWTRHEWNDAVRRAAIRRSVKEVLEV